MKNAVWKYPLRPSPDDRGLCQIEMPRGADPLTVSFVTGEACLWALIPLDAAGEPHPLREKRTFRVVGTGWKVDYELGRYIGTFFTPSDPNIGPLLGMPSMLVYHVFEGGT